jgi:hypothetical protein
MTSGLLVEKHYASFVQAARDSVQHRMDNGGTEERSKMSKTRREKITIFPAGAKNG